MQHNETDHLDGYETNKLTISFRQAFECHGRSAACRKFVAYLDVDHVDMLAKRGAFLVRMLQCIRLRSGNSTLGGSRSRPGLVGIVVDLHDWCLHHASGQQRHCRDCGNSHTSVPLARAGYVAAPVYREGSRRPSQDS